MLRGRSGIRNRLVWLQMTFQIACIDILHIWGRISHMKSDVRKSYQKIAQNRHFHDFWLSILKYVLTLGPYVFGSVERMLWSVSSPNVVVGYLETKPRLPLIWSLVFWPEIWPIFGIQPYFSQHQGQQMLTKIFFSKRSHQKLQKIYLQFFHSTHTFFAIFKSVSESAKSPFTKFNVHIKKWRLY